jgi:hypothetical protein
VRLRLGNATDEETVITINEQTIKLAALRAELILRTEVTRRGPFAHTSLLQRGTGPRFLPLMHVSAYPALEVRGQQAGIAFGLTGTPSRGVTTVSADSRKTVDPSPSVNLVSELDVCPSVFGPLRKWHSDIFVRVPRQLGDRRLFSRVDRSFHFLWL